MYARAYLAAVLLGSTLFAHAEDRMLPEPAQQLVTDVIYNELHDRESDSFWQYRSIRVAGEENLVREQVETPEGPIYRVIEDHGAPLDGEKRKRESQRLEQLVEKPGAMERIRREHEEDEARMTKVMEMLPKAFLFSYEGSTEGDQVHLSFRPNPDFVPTSYEARIIHALAGELIVNQRLKRLADMNGRLIERVDFGYGLLGHVEQGGTFEVRRGQVSETHWKTNLVEVHVRGKILLLKDVTKDQRETRSDFHPVPHDISLTTAKELLDQAAGAQTEARLAPIRR